MPFERILLASIQNAVPAFDHGARNANNSVARLIVRPAAVAGPGTTPGPAGQAVPAVPADRTPRAAVVVSPHGIPRKPRATKGIVRPVDIGPDHNPRIRLGFADRQ